MDILEHARRRAFSQWLRTGRLPRWAQTARTERKFNPWHDPDNGRFTFAGTGRYFGTGGPGGDVVRMDERPSNNDAINGGGASGGYPKPRPVRDRINDRPSDTLATPLARIAANNAKNWGRTIRGGYEYWLDADGQFREVEGTLKFGDDPRRSRTAQLQAGRPDRRPDDDGGHYIAFIFGGPTDAFNHFAQNANFNRGTYRRLEEQWAREMRAGKRVDVRIVAVYEGSSRRPSHLNVWFWVDGKPHSLQLPNERSETSRGKR